VLRRLVLCPPITLAEHCLLPNVHAKTFGFREYLDHALDQIYHFGQGDFIVVCRVLSVLRSVTHCATFPYHLDVLRNEFLDIKNDILKQKETFTAEGFAKIVREIELCEAAFVK
jgi:hypothetical protein